MVVKESSIFIFLIMLRTFSELANTGDVLVSEKWMETDEIVGSLFHGLPSVIANVEMELDVWLPVR
jgi:hypothetical protein